MANRRFNKPKPQSSTNWTKLMRKTIERANEVEDRRLPGLRRALSDGKAETLLRRMGIISEKDLFREFPVKAK